MGYLGRLTIKTDKRADKPVEYGVYENDAVMIDDEYNGNSHKLIPNILEYQDINTINNYVQDFTPIEINAEGGEQIYDIIFRDMGISKESYKVNVYLEVEEIITLEEFNSQMNK